jgi:hypothetical protein
VMAETTFGAANHNWRTERPNVFLWKSLKMLPEHILSHLITKHEKSCTKWPNCVIKIKWLNWRNFSQSGQPIGRKTLLK